MFARSDHDFPTPRQKTRVVATLRPQGEEVQPETVMTNSGSRAARCMAGWLVLLLVPGGLAAQAPATTALPRFYAPEPDLRAFAEDALERSPLVLEEFARYRGALQRVPQVTALPDPMLTFTQALQSVETRVGPQLNTVMISQVFPWFGKLALQGRVALQGAVARYHLYAARQTTGRKQRLQFWLLGLWERLERRIK